MLQHPSPGDDGAAWVLRYLLDRGLLPAGDVVCATPLAQEVSVSHRAWRVSVDGRARWFVKRADAGRSGGRDLSVEAAFYRLSARWPELSAVVPRCRHIGEADGLLVLDAAPGVPMPEAIERPPGPGGFVPALALQRYGDAVARVHRVRPAPFGQPPWLLQALDPRWGDYAWLPRPCARLLARLARSPAVRAGFDAARREWRRAGLVHGDVRWSNAFVVLDGDAAGARLVDWELACVGDPAWDLGSLLADVVATTVLGHAGATAHDTRPWCALVLEGYRGAAGDGGDPGAWAALLRRSARLAAVRLVQTLIEHGHGSAATLPDAEAALMPWVIEGLTRPQAVALALARDSDLARRAPPRERQAA